VDKSSTCRPRAVHAGYRLLYRRQSLSARAGLPKCRAHATAPLRSPPRRAHGRTAPHRDQAKQKPKPGRWMAEVDGDGAGAVCRRPSLWAAHMASPPAPERALSSPLWILAGAESERPSKRLRARTQPNFRRSIRTSPRHPSAASSRTLGVFLVCTRRAANHFSRVVALGQVERRCSRAGRY
jgi:hypothetical protein